MKQLKKWQGKEVELVIQGKTKTYTLQGYIWRYTNPFYVNEQVEYWIGYDGGIMERIYPKEVISIKEIKQ